MKNSRIYFFIPFIILLAQIFAKTKLKCYSRDEDVIPCRDFALTDICDVGYCVEIDGEVSNCCKETHCPETGLFSFPKLDTGRNLVKWDESYSKNTWYKNKQIFDGREEELACLIPKSFELSITASKFNKTYTPRCKKSDDCEIDEFCGSVWNPSFCYQNEKKNCLDKSDNGNSMKFCFKIPNVRNRTFVARRKDVGLPACNTNEDCKVELPTEKTSCEESEISIRRIENGVVKMYQKMCAKGVEENEKSVVVAESCWLTPVAVSGATMLFLLLLSCAAIFLARRVMNTRSEKERKAGIEATVKNSTVEKAKIILNRKKDIEKMDTAMKQKDILIEYMEKKEKAKS